MSDARAKEIIALRDREKARSGQFRTLYQSVSNFVFPQTYAIETQYAPGAELMNHLFDTTAVEEAENMASGLVNNLFPAGQRFFAIQPTAARDDSEVKRYVSGLTEAVHEAMFNSNFIQQVSNTIHYWVTFGTGSLYSDWTPRDGLNYRDYAVGTYQLLENSRGIIDTILLTCPMTARQIVQEWGIENVGKTVAQAYEKPETRENCFDVVHRVGPRADYDENETLRPATRMPFESVYVLEKDQIVLAEGGYDEFPFAVPRYQVIYREVWGRGRGVTLLPEVRSLNRLAKDYMEMSNKWVNPPREVLDSFEGNVDVTPGANNYVTTIPSFRAIEMGAAGAYPVTKDILEYRREFVRQGFFKNAFEALTNLSGDRRTTTEIIERLKEGMKRLSKPLGRLFVELLTPVITRSTLLLIRNGVVPRPPAALQDRPFKIEFVNPLALALRDQQSRGGQYWVAALGEAAAVFPDVTDNVESDRWARDLGEALGVKTDHIAPMRDVQKKRAERAAKQQQLEQMQMAMATAEGYGKTTKAPEEGSPAAALTGGA